MGVALSKSGKNLIKLAQAWCKFYHAGQVRKYTGAPYHQHPAAVAHLVKTVPHTTEMVCAAFMHDLLEDTAAPEDEMRQVFGPLVFEYVGWLTDVSCAADGNRETRKSLDREHLKAAPAEAKTIKLADLIDNSRSITKHDPDFAKVYLHEKRLLLDEALREGDATLWAMADEIVRKELR